MNLTHDPADIIRYLLISLGLGTLNTASGAWPIHVVNEPDTPDNCITVYNTAGKTQGRVMYSGSVIEKPGIQIRVRSSQHTTGYAKGKTIEQTLDTLVLQDTVTISPSVYHVQALSRTSNLLFLGKDTPTSKRPVFTLNYTATIWQV